MDDPKIIAAIVLLLTNVAALVKVCTDLIRMKADRADTKAIRDADSAKLHDDVLKHTMQIAQLKDNQAMHATVMDDLRDTTAALNTNVAKLGVVVEGLAEAVKELKNR